tara:strand:- start:3662 stop:5281 length:1620 start_codon:yes stop_codon:yes gene_type:complete
MLPDFAVRAQDQTKKKSQSSDTIVPGEWIGYLRKFDSDSACEAKFKLVSATVENSNLEITFKVDAQQSSVSGKIGSTRKFDEWTNFEIRMQDSYDTARATARFQGTFRDHIFDGYFNAQAGESQKRGGVLCEGSIQLAPKGSIEGEALLTGKDPKMVRLERQVAALKKAKNSASQSAPAKKPAKKSIKTPAEKEAEKKAKADAEAEKIKLALLQEIQDLIAERQRQEAARQAKIKSEAQKLARLRSDQKRIAERQRKEAKRLKKLRAETEAKSKQLAALQKQQVKTSKSKIPANINFGNYHALVIGINRYRNLEPLRTAVSDAFAVAEILSSKYGFKVTTLINSNRDDILNALDNLRANLTNNDNLLVYYAGHGWLDKAGDEGYWLPANAKKNRQSGWVSNASITTNLRAIKAKHVIVLADSCYSGRLIRGTGTLMRGIEVAARNRTPSSYLEKMARKKARVVMTSGGLEPVEDGHGKHSAFAQAIIDALNDNDGVLEGSKLFNIIRRPVITNADQIPQYSDVRRAGHNGGDFLFVPQK